MSMYPFRGQWVTKRIPTKANTAYVQSTLVGSDATDIVPMTSSITNIVGIVKEAKASANNTNKITIMVPKNKSCTYLCDDVAGTLTAAMVGRRFDGGADAGKIDAGATTYKHAKCEKFVSSTIGEFSINDPVT